MKINGLIKKALWENIECCCTKGNITKSYPLIKCDSCKFTECWKSVPQKDFTVNDDIIDIKTGKVTKKQTKTVKEITLVRGDKLEDVIGWTF
jgi:hypothetical protein|tara:strand:- start:315 stop:590 length:276 start_codon:yes stop_codon:yes gene_type:complete